MRNVSVAQSDARRAVDSELSRPVASAMHTGASAAVPPHGSACGQRIARRSEWRALVSLCALLRFARPLTPHSAAAAMAIPRCPLVFSAWVSLAAGFLLEFIAGSMYVFGSYAGTLRALLGINQKQIQLIGSLLNAGTWAGVLGGLVLDKIGPRTTAVSGAALMFVGYFTLYLAAAKIAFVTTNFFSLWCLLAFTAGQGGSFFVALGLKANLVNFAPTERGQVVGALQAFFGISAGVCSLVQRAWFADDVPRLLLTLAVLCSVAGGSIGLLVNSVMAHPWAVDSLRRHYSARIAASYAIAVAVALYILVVAVLKQTLSFSSAAVAACAAVALALTLSVVLLPVRTGPLVRRNTRTRANNSNSNNNSNNSNSLGGGENTADGPHSMAPDIIMESNSVSTAADDDFDLAASMAATAGPHELTGDTVKDTLTSLDFYLLFAIWLVGAGTANAFVNNIFSIVMSMSFDASVTHAPVAQAALPNANMAYTFVALFSSFNTLGRLGFGFVSDRLAGRFPRAFWLLVCVALIGLAQASLIVSNLNGLFFLVIVLGVCYGGLFGLMPSLIADRFGEKNFGLNYGLAAMAPALGSLLCSTLTAGGLSDYYATEHSVLIVAPDGAQSAQCIGAMCYRVTYALFTAALLGACAAAGLIWWRASRYNASYKNVGLASQVGTL